MSEDPRLAQLRRAAEQMQHGYFNVEVLVEGYDEVAKLAESLQALATNLEHRFDEVAKLARIAEQVNAGLAVDDILEQIYDSFRAVIPYDRIGLALLEDDNRSVRSRWSRSEAVDIKLDVGYSAKLAGSSLAEILETGRPRILNDLEAYLEEHPDSDSTRLILSEGIRSSLTCPLTAMGKPLGFLFFSSCKKNTYREIHQGHFMQLASQISVILEKGRIYEELVALNRRLQEMQQALAHEASHDALTGLWNRRAVLRLLEREIARAQREEVPLSVVILDLDHFKRINDKHGHLVGDEVLKEVGMRLLASLRSAELAGRLGGEEFLVILCPSSESGTRMVMERVRTACADTPFATSAGELPVTVSLGAATVSEVGDARVSTLLSAADRALYRAKGNGRNRWELSTLFGEPG